MKEKKKSKKREKEAETLDAEAIQQLPHTLTGTHKNMGTRNAYKRWIPQTKISWYMLQVSSSNF